MLCRKRTEYCNSRITKLEESTENPDKKRFWQYLKSMDDSQTDKDKHPLVSEENWLNYFHSLHSNKPLNPAQQAIINELKQLPENCKQQLCSLDYLITENEILAAAKRLKNNRSSFSDKIKNEMIKASLYELLPVCHKPSFNSILNLGTMPQTWWGGLIAPTYKSGGRSDPANYQGICVSSCLSKLFCSILNQRCLEHVNCNNILHNSQPSSRSYPHIPCEQRPFDLPR